MKIEINIYNKIKLKILYIVYDIKEVQQFFRFIDDKRKSR